MAFLSAFLLTLGLVQLIVTFTDLRGLSLTSRRRRLGYLTGTALLVGGALLLPGTLWVFFLVPPAIALALVCLATVGSLTGRHLDAARFLRPGGWPEGHCQAVHIPNGERVIPGLLITPPAPSSAAVCLIHGSGDTKSAFKWRLIRSLLDRKQTVLTIDLAGHGENQTPQRWPDCTTEIPVALEWLRDQPDVTRVGLLGISMGGALSAQAAVVASPDALTLCETPITFQFTRTTVRREAWDLLRSPILDLMGEITAWQIWRTWRVERGRREIALSELINRLDVASQVARLTCPVHLVYGQRDHIAPPDHGQRLHQAATVPSQLTVVPGASHLALILMPETNRAIADWLADHLEQRQSDIDDR